MTASADQSDAKLDVAKQHLQRLKAPTITSTLSTYQKQSADDRKRGRALWEEVLQDYHNKQSPADKVSGTGFLDLPPELRDVIYELSLEDERELRHTRKRTRDQYCNRPPPRQPRLAPSHSCTEALNRRPAAYTHLQRQQHIKSQELLDRISKDKLDQADRHTILSPGARDTYEEYKYAHDISTARCFHEEHKYNNVNNNVIVINERGNLCADLPSIALASRQILWELWGKLYPATTTMDGVNDGTRYKAKIRNLDFFLFLRFLHTIQRCKLADVTGEMVHVEFFEVLNLDDDADNREKNHYLRKFENVKRLITLHWLHGFPLWDALTVRGEGAKEVSRDDDRCYQGYRVSRDIFAGWMGAVREIVALYTIRRSVWRKITIAHLRFCDFLRGRDAQSWDGVPDEDVVDAVIGMLSDAIEYDLGYDGNFARGRESEDDDEDEEEDEDLYERGEDGFFRFQHVLRKVAYEEEHAVVLVARKYCLVVDRVLREELGDYFDEWRDSEDLKSMSQGALSL